MSEERTEIGGKIAIYKKASALCGVSDHNCFATNLFDGAQLFGEKNVWNDGKEIAFLRPERLGVDAFLPGVSEYAFWSERKSSETKSRKKPLGTKLVCRLGQWLFVLERGGTGDGIEVEVLG